MGPRIVPYEPGASADARTLTAPGGSSDHDSSEIADSKPPSSMQRHGVAEGVAEGERDGVALAEDVIEPVDDEVAVLVPVRLLDAVAVLVPVPEAVDVCDGVNVGLNERDGLALVDGGTLPVPDAETPCVVVPVAVAVLCELPVALAVSDAVTVDVSVAAAETDAVPVSVGADDAVPVDVGDAVIDGLGSR